MNSVAAKQMDPGPYTYNSKTRPLTLIIDDEEDVCFLLRDILHKQNMHNVCVNNLADARAFLQSNDPSVIFLDNKLSDGLGIDHIHLIKKEHPNTKIIMITAHDNYRDKAIEEGVDQFITKPFSKSMILDAIKSIAD